MKTKLSEQERESNAFGFIKPWHRRTIYSSVLAVSLMGNMWQIKKHYEQSDASEKVLHEMLLKQLETRQKVDTLINHIE